MARTRARRAPGGFSKWRADKVGVRVQGTPRAWGSSCVLVATFLTSGACGDSGQIVSETMSSFSWKGIFGISVPDSSGSPTGRSGSLRKTSGGPRLASSVGSAASPPGGSAGASSAAHPRPIRTDANGMSAGMGSPMRSSADVSSPNTFGSQRHDEAAMAASFPLSLGWSPPEWREWSRDSGHHVHDSETKSALLGIENVRTHWSAWRRY